MLDDQVSRTLTWDCGRRSAVLIYLDTKDLISLLSGSGPLSAEEFEAKLRVGGHKFILSSCAILE
jgi:hypothetical protein